jgi:hypothetical protein
MAAAYFPTAIGSNNNYGCHVVRLMIWRIGKGALQKCVLMQTPSCNNVSQRLANLKLLKSCKPVSE